MKLLLDGQIIEVPDEEPNITPDVPSGNTEVSKPEGQEQTQETELDRGAEPRPVVEEEPVQQTEEEPELSLEDRVTSIEPGIVAYTPASEAEELEYANWIEDTGKLFKPYLRHGNPVTSWIYAGWRFLRSGAQKYVQTVNNIIGGTDEKESTEDNFDLEEAFKQDGISFADRDLYQGVTTASEYEYIKNGVEEERTDVEALNQADMFQKTIFFGADLLTPIPGLGALNMASKATRLGRWRKIFAPFEKEVLNDVVKGMQLGAVFAGLDYAASYDMDIEEAGYRALTGGLVASGLQATFGTVSRKLAKKITDDITELVNAEDITKFVHSRMKEMWEESLRVPEVRTKTIGDKVTKALASSDKAWNPESSHPYMMIYSNNQKVRDMANRIFKYNDEVIEFAKWVDGDGNVLREAPAELRINFYNMKDATDYQKALDMMAKHKKEIMGFDGTTPREWFTRCFYGGEMTLPENLPHREKIISAVKNLKKKTEALRDMELDVMGQTQELEASFLPAEETGGRFSIERIVERQRKGIKGIKPGYLPRLYDKKAIANNQIEFRELLKQGLINTKASELGENATVEELEAYAQSKELKEILDKQYADLTAGEKRGIGSGGNSERRTVRVDDRALYEFFRKDAIENLYSYVRRERTRLEFERAVKDAGYQDWRDFRKSVAKDYDKLINDEKVLGLNGSSEVISREKDKTLHLIDQCEAIIKYRYLPLNEAIQGLGANAKALNLVESARNTMYAAYLGRAALNSFTDIKGMTARYGLGDVVVNLGGSLVDSFNNAVRHIAHLPKTQQRELLDALVTGIEDTKLHASLRFTPLQNDELFFGSSNATWDKKLLMRTEKMANAVMIGSGTRYLDHTIKRTAAKLYLKQLLKNPKRAKEVSEMLANREFSDDVLMEIYNNVQKMSTVPSMADMPRYALKSTGRFFNILHSWVHANATNYFYPMLKGAFTRSRLVQSLMTVVSLQMLQEYARGWLKGKQYDLSDEKSREKFKDNVLTKSLEDVAGSLPIFFDGIRSMYMHGIKRRDPAGGFANLSPLASYAGNLTNLGYVLLGAATGRRISYRAARRGLQAVPGQNIPYIEPFINKVASAISGEERPE